MKRGIMMREFMRKFTQLNGVGAKVVLNHYLFDKQVFHCDKLKTVSDNKRVGLILKNQKIFMYQKDVQAATIEDNTLMISDGRLTITITVSNL